MPDHRHEPGRSFLREVDFQVRRPSPSSHRTTISLPAASFSIDVNSFRWCACAFTPAPK
jgi:hypothetical protein